MPVSIEVVETGLFAAVVADEIVASINDFVSEKGSCSVAVAGGKTPSVIYRTIAKPPRVREVDWPNVRLFWGDERWVPQDDIQSNFRMVQETLVSHLPGNGPAIFGVNTALSSPPEGAADYERRIREALGADNPAFDLVLLGVGEDGHTASIFPGSQLLKEEHKNTCAAVPGPGGSGWRVSVTPAVLENARRLLFIVRGDVKAQVLKEVLEGPDDIINYPAQIYRRAKGQVSFFVDTGAAQQLNIKGKAN